MVLLGLEVPGIENEPRWSEEREREAEKEKEGRVLDCACIILSAATRAKNDVLPEAPSNQVLSSE